MSFSGDHYDTGTNQFAPIVTIVTLIYGLFNVTNYVYAKVRY